MHLNPQTILASHSHQAYLKFLNKNQNASLSSTDKLPLSKTYPLTKTHFSFSCDILIHTNLGLTSLHSFTYFQTSSFIKICLPASPPQATLPGLFLIFSLSLQNITSPLFFSRLCLIRSKHFQVAPFKRIFRFISVIIPPLNHVYLNTNLTSRPAILSS